MREPSPTRAHWLVALAAPLLGGCSGCEPEPVPGAGVDAGATPVPSAPDSAAPPRPPEPPPEGRCPREMVRVAKTFCVDRYEAQLVEVSTKSPLSPYYPPSRAKAKYVEEQWQSLSLTEGNARARSMPLPPLPDWQKDREIEPLAISRRGVVPSAYASGVDAETACRNAGKRLCTRDEWTTACRGEADRDFPYGERYEQGRCNVFREGHPGIELYDNPSIHHSDPRFNLVTVGGKPLLRRTGDTKTCASVWEGDAIFDMVGNLDEWIDDPEGTFLGGFFARAKKDGCRSAVSSHPKGYADYSTGVRCCRDLTFGEPAAGDKAEGDVTEPEGEPR